MKAIATASTRTGNSAVLHCQLDMQSVLCINHEKQKPKKPTWIDVKKSNKHFENSQLIELVKELYQLTDENKAFLCARFLAGNDALDRYKKIFRRRQIN